ncbi:hypothetical protein Tco_0599488 [Tanacetum coccineum]
MAMTIKYGVRGMILTAQSEAFKQDNDDEDGSNGMMIRASVLMPRVVKSRDEIFSRWGYCDNRGLSRLHNQSIERDRLIGIGFVLDFVEFISFTFGDKEMILVIEAIIREEFVKLLLDSFGKLSISDSLVEETDTLLSHFNDSSTEYETFCFNIEEKSSGNTTTHSNYSLSDYETFYFDDDHIEEKSSGSTTTHSDFSLPEYD